MVIGQCPVSDDAPFNVSENEQDILPVHHITCEPSPDGKQFVLDCSITDHYAASLPEVGALGLPITEFGEALQSIAGEVVNRSNVEKDKLIAFLKSNAFDEDEFWTRFGGPATDWLEDSAKGAL